MATMIKHFPKIHIAFGILLASFLVSCQHIPISDKPPTATYPPSMPDNKTPPKVISGIYPDSIICQEEYEQSKKETFIDRGIGFTFWDDLNKFHSFSIDGKTISNDTRQIADGLMPGPYYMSWTPELSPGEHQATIAYQDDYGKIKYYSWNFIVTAQSKITGVRIPTPKPTPNGIFEIDPDPNMLVLCRSTYERWLMSPGYYHGGIIVMLNFAYIDLKKEYRVEKYLRDNIVLAIDGEEISPETLNVTIYKERNEGLVFLNWLIELSPELHELVFTLTNEQKESLLVYQWRLQITDN